MMIIVSIRSSLYSVLRTFVRDDSYRTSVKRNLNWRLHDTLISMPGCGYFLWTYRLNIVRRSTTAKFKINQLLGKLDRT